MDQGRGLGFVTCWNPFRVDVLDLETHDVVTAFATGRHPSALAIDPTDALLLVANEEDNTVQVLDEVKGSTLATIPVGRDPLGIALDHGLHRAYVTNGLDESVSVIDTTSMTVTATWPVGYHPIGIAVDPGTHRVYASSVLSRDVPLPSTQHQGVLYVLQPDGVQQHYNVGSYPVGVALDPSYCGCTSRTATATASPCSTAVVRPVPRAGVCACRSQPGVHRGGRRHAEGLRGQPRGQLSRDWCSTARLLRTATRSRLRSRCRARTQTSLVIKPGDRPLTGRSLKLDASTTSISATPAGSVAFEDNGQLIGTVALANGAASLTTTLTEGAHSLVARYTGTAAFLASTASLQVTASTETWLKADGTATKRARARPATGYRATLRQLVGNAPVADAVLTFLKGTTVVCKATTDTGGVASCPMTSLPPNQAAATRCGSRASTAGQISAATFATCCPQRPTGRSSRPRALLDRDGLREVARLVDVEAAGPGDLRRQHLQRHHREHRGEQRLGVGDPDDGVGVGRHATRRRRSR